MKKHTTIVTFILLLAFFITACTSPSPATSTSTDKSTAAKAAVSQTDDDAKNIASHQVKVAVTFDAIAEFVTAVGGERVTVARLVPDGSSAHHYEPRAKDLLALGDADVLFINGLNMESWVDSAVKSLDNKTLKVIDTSAGVDLIAAGQEDADDHDHGDEHADETHDDEHKHEDEHADESHDDEHKHEDEHADESHDDEHEHEDEHADESHNDEHKHEDEHADESHNDEHEHEDDHDGHDHGPNDPHIWLGLSTARKQIDNVKTALIELDPAGSTVYEQNAKAISERLETLQKEYADRFAALKRKEFVTGHSAFAYLCRDLGLTQNSVQNLFAEGEPSPRQLAELVDFCREHGVTTIFAEKAANAEVAGTLAGEVNASVRQIYTMEQAEDGMSYIERVEKNLAMIYEALKDD